MRNPEALTGIDPVCKAVQDTVRGFVPEGSSLEPDRIEVAYNIAAMIISAGEDSGAQIPNTLERSVFQR